MQFAASFKNVLIVSSSTLGSRLLGLLRDIVIFSFLGTSSLNAAFLLAFTLPNLFRRLLGEGALTSAMMPVLAEASEKEGVHRCYDVLNQLLTRLCIGLGCLTVVGIGLLYGLSHIEDLPERWHLATIFSQWLMPYMPLVCLAAIFSGALNLSHRFAAAALAPMALNLSMVLCICMGGLFWAHDGWRVVQALCIGVLLGGIAQLLLPLLALKQQGWRFRWQIEKSHHIHEIVCLFLPGLAGAAILQINLLISRLLAFALDDAAISLLYLAGRLVELPLGLFTIAVATVIFPQLARLVVQQEHTKMAYLYGQGLRLVLAITVPAAVGLLSLARPIIQTLFEWGAFNMQDVQAAIPVLMCCSLGIPLYSWATLATKACHAFKDTRTPVKMAFIALVIHILLSLWWMHVYGVLGLAAASVVCVCIQSYGLHYLLSKKTSAFELIKWSKPLLHIGLASAGMYILLTGGQFLWEAWIGTSKMAHLIMLAVFIPVGVCFYLIQLFLLRFEDIALIRSMFKHLFKRL